MILSTFPPLPPCNGVYSIKKEFVLSFFFRKFFRYRVDTFSEGFWRAVKQTGSHINCLPISGNEQKLYQVYPVSQRG